MPLGTTKEIDLPSGHKCSVELTNQYAKLTTAGIPTLTGKVYMIRSKHIMNGSDKLKRKVDLIKANESQGVDNSLDKEKSTYLKNQNIMTIQNIMANQNGMFETPNGCGVNMNSVVKAIKVIMSSKLEMKLGQLMKFCP